MVQARTNAARRVLAAGCALGLFLLTSCQSNGMTRSAEGPSAPQQVSPSPVPSGTVSATKPAETGAPQPDMDEGEPAPDGVSTSNGGFTLRPAGQWQARVEKLREAYADDHDPVERLILTHPQTTARGEILIGEITSSDKFEERVENLSSVRVPNLDAPPGKTASLGDAETYIVEYINQSVESKKYIWRMSIVSKSSQMASEFDAGVYFTARKPGTIAEAWYIPEGDGDAGLAQIEEFAKSEVRDELVHMFSGLQVEQKPV